MSYASQDAGRHALLVGICSYPNFGPGAQLTGCVADVRAMERVLRRRFGFSAESILRLEDGEATRERILSALAALRSRVRRGDVVVVHYSGHGSRVRSPERPSGWAETLVPSDSGRAPLPNRDITDSELRAWLLEISKTTPYLTLIFDSCFSGSIVRGTARARWVAPDPRPLTRPPAGPPGAEGMRDVGPSGWLPLSDRYVLFAGCRADEESFELSVDQGQGSHHGALTYHLCRELEVASVTASYRDVFEPVAARVTASFSRQHPQLEGARHRGLFGLQDVPATLENLYPDPVDELPRLAVELPKSEALAGSPWLRAVTPGEEADLRVVLLSPRERVADGDPVPRLGALSEPLWVVLGPDGGLLLPPLRADAPDPLPRLVTGLERCARFRHLLALDNRDPDSRLRGRLEVALRRRRPGKTWETAEGCVPGTGAAIGPSFDEGDQVALAITNRHSETVYITVLDFGLSGRISVLFPVVGAQQPVLPERTLHVGEDPQDPMVLALPKGFPFDGPCEGAPVEGVEHFKVLATLHEADFQPLAQEGYPVDSFRHAGSAGRLGARLERILTGRRSLPVRASSLASLDESRTDDWTQVTRSFVLRGTSTQDA